MRYYNIDYGGKPFKIIGKKIWRNWNLILKDIEGDDLKEKLQYLADQCETINDLASIIEEFDLQVPRNSLYERMRLEGIYLKIPETEGNLFFRLFGRGEKILTINLFNYYEWLQKFLESNPDIKEKIANYNKRILADEKIQAKASKEYEERIAIKDDWQKREILLCQMEGMLY